MSSKALLETYRDEIENELQQAIAQAGGARLEELHTMLAYHMGWYGEGAGPKATGKRIRPLLVLLSTASAGGEWTRALPAAAAVELIHNFSLIHDDIEDNSPLRRGRPTVWKLWGISQAINTGDAMFTLAHLALLRLDETNSTEISLEAAKILGTTCLRLTQGQYLDISYEDRNNLTLEDYWPMVRGKTAALLACCTELGALVAGVDRTIQEKYRGFGRDLGLAFQAQDDLLGIWGEASQIGKSNLSDLVEGKKSLPVLYGLEQNGLFAERWRQGPITPQEVPTLAVQLELEGARLYTQETANELTQQALSTLEEVNPQGEAGEALMELAKQLLRRDS